MDPLSQIALGAAVGEAVLGCKVGRRAPVWGGLCGLQPDLDVLWPYADAVSAFTWHRGYSHAFLPSRLHPGLLKWRDGAWDVPALPVAVAIMEVLAPRCLLAESCCPCRWVGKADGGGRRARFPWRLRSQPSCARKCSPASCMSFLPEAALGSQNKGFSGQDGVWVRFTAGEVEPQGGSRQLDL